MRRPNPCPGPGARWWPALSPPGPGSGVDAVVAAAAGIVPALGRGEGLVVFCTTVADARTVRTRLGKPCKERGAALELLTGGMPERFTRGVVNRLETYRTGYKNREKNVLLP